MKLWEVRDTLYFSLIFFGMFSWLPLINIEYLNGFKYLLAIGFFLFGIGLRVKPSAATRIYFLVFISIVMNVIFFSRVSQVVPGLSILITLLAIDKIPRDKVINLSLNAMLLFALVNSAYMIFSYMHGVNYSPSSVVGAHANLPYSTMGFSHSHTMISPILGVALLAIIFKVFIDKEVKVGVLSFLAYLLIFFIIAIAMYLSGGEGGGAALFISLFFYVCCRLLGVRATISFMIIFLIFIAFYWTAFLECISHSSSLLERLVSVTAGLRMFQDSPFFGVGVGNSYNLFSEYTTAVERNSIFSESLVPHNVPVYILAEMGLMAIPYFLLFFLIIKEAFKLDTPKYTLDTQLVFPLLVIIFYASLALVEPWPFVNNVFSSVILYTSLSAITRRKVA